jgi:hypothetical protein
MKKPRKYKADEKVRQTPTFGNLTQIYVEDLEGSPI